MIRVYLRKFEWDTYNVSHIALHDVVPEEVEEVCKNDVARRDGRNNYIILIGKTQENRISKIVLEQKEHDIFRPVTAHDASRKERNYYQEVIGGEKVA